MTNYVLIIVILDRKRSISQIPEKCMRVFIMLTTKNQLYVNMNYTNLIFFTIMV